MNPLHEAMRVAVRAALAINAEARACTERQSGKAIAFEWHGQRMAIRFADGTVTVDGGEGGAAATVRGSPVAVVGALLGGERHTAAVLGEVELFEDFRMSFRPHLPHLPRAPRHLAEDIGDAAHIAARAAQSALEGLIAGLRDQPAGGASEHEAAESNLGVEELRARLAELEARLAAMETEAPAAEQNLAEESPPPAP